MENRMMKLAKGGVFFIVIILVASSTTAMTSSLQEQSLSLVKKTGTFFSPSRDETELKYYDGESLGSECVGISTDHAIWKSAIRLTQGEMAIYIDWSITKVNVAFIADFGCPSIDVRIYIYDKGTSTVPGPLIANDTTCTLNETGIITIPLVTPVPLRGHDELWVAIEWMQVQDSGVYAVMDGGPAVDGKGDWIYLNALWSETQWSLDCNWGIGAIIEGTGTTQLMIGNINGPIGVHADVKNIGLVNATNVSWSMTASGGILSRVNASAMGTEALLATGASTPISLDLFIGFGRINILITAKAKNAIEVIVIKSAFLLGPFVIVIK